MQIPSSPKAQDLTVVPAEVVEDEEAKNIALVEDKEGAEATSFACREMMKQFEICSWQTVIDINLNIPTPVTDIMDCGKERPKRKWKTVDEFPKVGHGLHLDLGPLLCLDAHGLEGSTSD